MCLTLSTPTPNSSAAETPWYLPSGLVGRHEVGDVAHHEQLAGPRVEDHLRRHPRVAAADHHDLGRLAVFGQLAIAILLGLQPAAGEGAVAVDQTLRKTHALFLANLMPRSPSPIQTHRAAAGSGKAARFRHECGARWRRRPAHRADRRPPRLWAARRSRHRPEARRQSAGPGATPSPGSYGRLLTFFGSVKRPAAVESPERQLGMHLEHPRGGVGVAAQALIHLADFRRRC